MENKIALPCNVPTDQFFYRHNLRTNIKHKFIKRASLDLGKNEIKRAKIDDSSDQRNEKLRDAEANRGQRAATAKDPVASGGNNGGEKQNIGKAMSEASDLGQIGSIDEGTKLFHVDVEENSEEFINSNVSWQIRH